MYQSTPTHRIPNKFTYKHQPIGSWSTLRTNKPQRIGSQPNLHINKPQPIGSQPNLRINKPQPIESQINLHMNKLQAIGSHSKIHQKGPPSQIESFFKDLMKLLIITEVKNAATDFVKNLFAHVN